MTTYMNIIYTHSHMWNIHVLLLDGVNYEVLLIVICSHLAVNLRVPLTRSLSIDPLACYRVPGDLNTSTPILSLPSLILLST